MNKFVMFSPQNILCSAVITIYNYSDYEFNKIF